MALTYDISKVANKEELKTGEGYQLLKVVSHFSMVLDIGNFTEKNMPEICFRSEFWQTLHGTEKSQWITCQELQRMQGLATNVGFQPRSKWIKHVIDEFEKKVQRNLKQSSATV
jgi:hypothetical protein